MVFVNRVSFIEIYKVYAVNIISKYVILVILVVVTTGKEI